MTLTSESAKLLLSDPKAWITLYNNGRCVKRNKLEDLVLCMMYNRDEVVNNFIAESKAPPSPKIAKFIKEFTDEINYILRNREDITRDELNILQRSIATRLDLPIEEAITLIKKHDSYYTFMLAKEEKIVVTEAEVLQAKANINLFQEGSGYMNELIKPRTYDRYKLTASSSEGELSADAQKAIEYFPYQLRTYHDDSKITYSRAGQENVYCNRQYIGNYIDSASKCQINVPVDIVNIYPTSKRADYANIYYCKGSLRNARDIILNTYYLEVAFLTHFVRINLPVSLRTFNTVFHLVLVDENNYIGIVRLTETMIKTCVAKAAEDLQRIRNIMNAEIYHTFPEFKKNLVYDL